MPKLTVKSPEFAGQVFDLNQPTVSIGRGEENTYQLAHPSVSTHHAEFRQEGGDYKLLDLGSTNGTRVNDERITESILRNGDVVMLGNMILAYQSETAAAASPMPSAETRVTLAGAPTGCPADFKNLAPFPKPKSGGSGGFPVLILAAALVALGGIGFLLYAAFLGS
jgi:predicted component of type VI protein secretion system